MNYKLNKQTLKQITEGWVETYIVFLWIIFGKEWL